MIKRISFWIFFLAIISYLVYLLINKTTIVNENFLDQNNIIFWLYLLIFLYFLVFYSIKPKYISKYKLRNTLIGIFLVTASQTFLLNSGHESIYYWDIFTVIWIFLTIIWPTKILVSQKISKENKDKKMEVIEV